MIVICLVTYAALTMTSFDVGASTTNRVYELDLRKLDALWHQHALSTLLKLKARTLLHEAARVERVVYESCAAEAASTIAQAKCVVRLMNAVRMNLTADHSGSTADERHTSDAWADMRRFWEHVFTPRRSPTRSSSHNQIRFRRDASTNANTKNGSREFRHVKNLQRLNRFLEMRSFSEKFLRQVSDENARFFMRSFGVNVDYRMDDDRNHAALADDVIQMLSSFLNVKDGKVSVLSPKLLSLAETRRTELRRILSPSILPFHYVDEGQGPMNTVLPIPKLLELSGIKNEFERDAWLDLLLELSGAGARLDSILAGLAPEIEHVERRVFPAVLELERLKRNWQRVHESLDDAQRTALDNRGYTFLRDHQIEGIYDRSFKNWPNSFANIPIDKMTVAQREFDLEQKIRQLAALDIHLPRRRRDVVVEHTNLTVHVTNSQKTYESTYGKHNGGDPFSEIKPCHKPDSCHSKKNMTHEREPDGHVLNQTEHNQDDANLHHEKNSHEQEDVELNVLKPFAFSSFIGHGIALEGLVLSPFAFVNEFGSPEALIAQVLTPRAFISSVLSPGVLMARVLSPAAFRAEILSPRALSTFVLTPEAFIAEVLSPKALDSRVLSPEILITKILSPEFLVPKVYSPEMYGIVVLSPRILSPHIYSGEKFMVEIISPSILSTSIEDEHSHEKASHELHAAHSNNGHHGTSEQHNHLAFGSTVPGEYYLMALTLPLHILDGLFRCYGIIPSTLSMEQMRLAELLIRNAALFDVIRWRRVSKTFRKLADRRLQAFTRMEVRMYNGISELHKHSFEKDAYELHPHANVVLVELGPSALGIGIDTKMKTEDVKALVQLLSTFRLSIRELFMDSPIIEMLVSQINRQQLEALLGLLLKDRSSSLSNPSSPVKVSCQKVDEEESCCKMSSFSFSPARFFQNAIVPARQSSPVHYGPFFPQLKNLTITSKSNQLEHLSRLLNYSVSVDFLYRTAQIDLLCLKICMGTTTQWSQKPHIRMFRHVTRFRQWMEAGTLGERYFQQFTGGMTKKSTRH